MCARCDHALRRREDDLQGVALPGPAGVWIGDAGPEVDDPTAVVMDAHRCADLLVPLDISFERLPAGREAGLGETVDLHLFSSSDTGTRVRLSRRQSLGNPYVSCQGILTHLRCGH